MEQVVPESFLSAPAKEPLILSSRFCYYPAIDEALCVCLILHYVCGERQRHQQDGQARDADPFLRHNPPLDCVTHFSEAVDGDGVFHSDSSYSPDS